MHIKQRHLYVKRYAFLGIIGLLLMRCALFPVQVAAYSAGQENLDKGSFFYHQGKYEQAKEFFQKAVRQDAGLIKAWENLGWAHYRCGENEAALRIWEAVAKIDPSNIAVLNGIADIYIASKNPQKAVFFLKKSLSAAPHQIPVKMRLASAYQTLHKTQEAASIYSNILMENPMHKDAALQLARLYQDSDRYSDALNLLKKHAAYQPDLKPYLIRLYCKKGDRFLSLKKYDAAITVYTDALKWDTNSGILYERIGQTYHRQGNLDKALNAFQKALRLGGPEQRLLRALGDIELEKKAPERAEIWYNRAIKKRKSERKVLKKLGWAFWKAGDWENCERSWLRLAAAFPGDAEPWALLTRLYLQEKKYSQAIKMAGKSLAKDKDQPLVALLRGRAYIAIGNFSAARESAATLARQYPDNFMVQRFFGEILMQYHDFNQGKVQWRKVLELNTQSPLARYYWIKSLYESGERERALQEARKVINRQETLPDLRLLTLLKENAIFYKDLHQAVNWLQKIVSAAPDRIAEWLELATLYQKTSQYEKAEKTLRRAQPHFGEKDDYLMQRAYAELALARGAYLRALEISSKMRAAFPYNRQAYILSLSALIADRQHDRALKLLGQNQPFFLGAGEAGLKRGLILRASGQLGRAADTFRVAIDQAGQNVFLPILLYHGLTENEYGKNLPVGRFDDQLKALKSAGYTTITAAQLAAIVAGKKKWPPKPIMITFDDCRIDSFKLGDPVLARYGMRASMFVPTMFIKKDHPFFADWEMIMHYAQNGRWDMQSHGNHAHELIDVDEDQDKGMFLANLKWLDEHRRMETPTEFMKRVDADYAFSKALLKTKIPGSNIVGYAFPYSEAGQEGATNITDGAILTQRAMAKHYAYGFIQNQSGYNGIPVKGKAPSILWRFTVPQNWGGDELLLHLAQTYPPYLAEKELAKTYYLKGRYEEARAIFQKWNRANPILHNELAYHLAAIDFHQGDHRKAQKGLTDYMAHPPQSGIPTYAKDLAERLKWKTSPQAQLMGGYSYDKNGRKNDWSNIRINYPFTVPVDAYIGIGHYHFREDGASLRAAELAAGIDWRVNAKLDLKLAVKRRQFDEIDATNSGSVAAIFHDIGKLNLSFSRRDVDTLSALSEGIQADEYGISYSRPYADNWFMRVNASYLQYDDDNERYNVRCDFSYRFPALNFWRVGMELGYNDTEKTSPLYYSPDELKIGRLYVGYRRDYPDGWSLDALAGLGAAEDQANGGRASGIVQGVLHKKWADRWQTNFKVRHSQVPNYYSTTVEAALSYRF